MATFRRSLILALLLLPGCKLDNTPENWQVGQDAYLAGKKAAEKGDPKEAIAQYTNALNLWERYRINCDGVFLSYMERGQEYRAVGDIDAARRDFERAEQLATEEAEPKIRGLLKALDSASPPATHS